MKHLTFEELKTIEKSLLIAKAFLEETDQQEAMIYKIEKLIEKLQQLTL